jgi:hypothetical protein
MSCTSAQSKPGPATSWKGPPPPKAPCHPRAGAGSLTIGRRRHQSVSRKRMAGFLLRVGLCALACKKHDSSAAEGGQPGGAPWRRPRIPATAEASKGRSRPGRAKRWRGCYRGRTAGDVQRPSTMTACEALAEHPKGGRAVCSAAEQGPDRAGVCT